MSTIKARRGHTNDPCHGCGKPDTHRPTHGVCSYCRSTLNFAEKIKAENEAAGDQSARPYYTKERDYALPYIRYDNSSRGPSELKKRFFELSVLISQPSKESPSDYLNQDNYLWPLRRTDEGHDWRLSRAFVPAQANALRALYSAVQEATVYAYKEGHSTGRDLLGSLAAGRITADEFNNKAIRADQEGR